MLTSYNLCQHYVHTLNIGSKDGDGNTHVNKGKDYLQSGCKLKEKKLRSSWEITQIPTSTYCAFCFLLIHVWQKSQIFCCDVPYGSRTSPGWPWLDLRFFFFQYACTCSYMQCTTDKVLLWFEVHTILVGTTGGKVSETLYLHYHTTTAATTITICSNPIWSFNNIW